MKVSHAAALALIGWYLLVPLPDRPAAPMKYWGHYGSFDTAKECEDAEMKILRESRRADFKTPPGRYSDKEFRQALKTSECIATDDPRLKEK